MTRTVNINKINFLKHQFVGLIKNLDPQTKPQWGVMNAQQMIEHMSDSTRIANGKTSKKILLADDQVERAKAFMMTEKPFRPNTKNIELPETPLSLRNKHISEAIDELQTEIDDFFKVFESDPSQKITNPFFGNLNFDEWVQLLHKHAVHHAKQFGLLLSE